MLFFSSFFSDFTTSSWVISRPNPRSTPSTSRRYLTFSPNVISQLAIRILQFVIRVKGYSIVHRIYPYRVGYTVETNRRNSMRFALCACFLVSSSLHAALLGPSPYLSFADSPFSGGSFSNFFLETFEGGSLGTPGVSASAGLVIPPGVSTDSVDGDDGTIDGFGTLGHSFLISTSNTVVFTFNPAAFAGKLPTHAGIVWTDVGNTTQTFGFSGVTFTALDQNGISLGSIGPFILGDGQITGQTAEDRFFGVTNP